MRSRSFGEHRRESVQAGLTLLELMLVLVLLGVLSVYAVVSYREQLLGAQRALGISELHVLEARQARFRLRYGRYAAALSELGLGEAAYGIDARGRHVPRDNKRRIYLFELSTTPNGHAFVATPQLGQGRDSLCGQLQLNHLGVRSVSGAGGVRRCWSD